MKPILGDPSNSSNIPVNNNRERLMYKNISLYLVELPPTPKKVREKYYRNDGTRSAAHSSSAVRKHAELNPRPQSTSNPSPKRKRETDIVYTQQPIINPQPSPCTTDGQLSVSKPSLREQELLNPLSLAKRVGASFKEPLEREIEDEYHPLVVEYFSKMGDLDLFHERLQELMEEKESLEAERESRYRFGLELAPDDLVWLEGSQTLIDELSQKIRLVEQDVESKKQECMFKGLVGEDGEPSGLAFNPVCF
jgi:hypothetical protein